MIKTGGTFQNSHEYERLCRGPGTFLTRTEDFKEVLKSTMTYRRERSIRDAYDERFLSAERGYPRPAGPAERRGPYSRPEDGYGRGDYEYDRPFFPNGGGPRTYHGEDQRPYHGNDNVHFPAERRTVPPSRREEYPYRVPREEPHTGRPIEFGARAPPPPSVRNQALYPAARSLPDQGDDTLMQAILNIDRGEDRDPYRRKTAPALFNAIRERSPVRREVARSPHSRSGSSVSSRGYSPDRTKGLPFPSQQGKSADGPEGLAAVPDHLWGALFSLKSGHDTLDKVPGLSRDGSPQSTTSNKEEIHPLESEKEEPVAPPVPEESHKSPDDFQERRTKAITAKAQEIEKVYRQDCETFGMVVKMLVAKDPALEKQLQVPLRENLGEIRERCLEDLKHFISDLDDAVRQPDPNV